MKNTTYLLIIFLSLFNFLYSAYDNVLEDTPIFVEDLKVVVDMDNWIDDWMQGVGDVENNNQKILMATRATHYMLGYENGKEFALLKVNENRPSSSVEYSSLEDYLKIINDRSSKTVETLGYDKPYNTTRRIESKVILKYVEENPEKLTEPIFNLIELAFKDAWGKKE